MVMVAKKFPAHDRTTNKGKGFTLIELLVVLAIIATLLTLVAPRYFGSVDRAKSAAAEHWRHPCDRDSLQRATGKIGHTRHGAAENPAERKIPPDMHADRHPDAARQRIQANANPFPCNLTQARKDGRVGIGEVERTKQQRLHDQRRDHPCCAPRQPE